MVGLPYPNIKSPELKEKMDYLNANMVNIKFQTITKIMLVLTFTEFLWDNIYT